MKPRIPLAYAGLLVTALLAIVGFAAFSPSVSTVEESPTSTVSVAAVPDVSARVASAVLALGVTDSESRVAAPGTTAAPAPTDTASEPTTSTTALETTTSTLAPTATLAASGDEPAVVESADVTVAATAASDTTPPRLRVTSPDNNDTVTSRVVTFEGTSEPGATVTSGPYAASMSDNGDWTMKLTVIDGANGASFTATDEAGNSASLRIVVYYNTPSASPTTTKAPTSTGAPAATTTTTHAPTTTKAPTPTATTTTTHAPTTTNAPTAPTTTNAPSSKWSPNWPADAGGIRNVEAWRSTVEKYWPAGRVDCALGIILRESRGDPRAYNSSSSAEGLMQHLSKYWVTRAKGAGFIDGNGLVASPYNGAANIAAGAYLASYYDGAIGQWWNPWKSGSGGFTATYGSCTSSNPG